MASLTEVLAILIKADGSSAVGAFDKVGDSARRNLSETQQHSDAMGKNFQKTGLVAAGAGVAILAGFGVAVGAAAKFEKQMSEVGAVSNATGGQLDRLSQAALDAGQATAFSASDAARAEAELAKAGVSTADILGGALKGSLDLAAAGQIELGQAATIAAQAMNIFNLQGKDVGHVADVLAAGANKSAADVGQLGEALQQGGLLAKQTGLSLEETVGTLALFADNALVGSDAGTSLKSMLQRLTPQSKEAADKMSELGISAYDSQGQFIGLDEFAGNLRESLSGLTVEQRNTALATIFGSDAVRGANVLYNAGKKGVREYTSAVDDQGAAADTAAKKMDNLAGDLERLKGSIETALIGSGSKATGPLREMAQGAESAVNSFTQLPGGVQSSIVGLVTITGIALTAGGALVFVAGSAMRANVAMQQLSVSSPAAATGLKGLGLVGVAVAGQQAISSLDDLGASLYTSATGSEAAGFAFRYASAGGQALTGNIKPLIDTTIDLGRNLLGMSDGSDEAAEKTKKLKNELGPAATEAERLAKMQVAAQKAVESHGISSDQAQAAIARYRDATGQAATAQDQFTIATTDSVTALENLKNASLGAFGAQLSYAQAQQQNTQAIAGVATAQQALNDATAEFGPNSQQAADAQLQLNAANLQAQQANFGLVTSSFELQAQMKTLEDQVRNGNVAGVDALIGKLREEMAQHPETAATIGPLIYQLELLRLKAGQVTAQPATVTVVVDNGAFDHAIRRIREVDSALSAGNRNFAVPITGSSGMKRYASGGTAPKGELAIFGEDGPELAVPAQDLQVFTAAQTQRIFQPRSVGSGGGSGGGGNMNIVINMQPGADGADVVRAIKTYERSSGAGWRN